MNSSLFEWVVSRFLIEQVSLALDIRYINFVDPILGIDFFERNRNDFFFSVQNAHNVFHDLFGKLVPFLFRAAGGKLHNNVGTIHSLGVYLARFSNTSLMTGSAEKTLGQPA
jgi:hypothetical protein